MEDVPIPSTTVSLLVTLVSLHRNDMIQSRVESTNFDDYRQMLSRPHLFCFLLLVRRVLDMYDTAREF